MILTWQLTALLFSFMVLNISHSTWNSEKTALLYACGIGFLQYIDCFVPTSLVTTATTRLMWTTGLPRTIFYARNGVWGFCAGY